MEMDGYIAGVLIKTSPFGNFIKKGCLFLPKNVIISATYPDFHDIIFFQSSYFIQPISSMKGHKS